MPKWLEIRVEPVGTVSEGALDEPLIGSKDVDLVTGAGVETGGKPVGLRLALSLGLVLLVIASGAWFALRPRRAASSLPTVVAIINGEKITRGELQAEVNLSRAMSLLTRGSDPAPDEASLRRFQTKVLNQLVDDRLMLQEASRARTTVSDQEVQAQIVNLEAQIGFPEDQLRQELARFGVEPSLLEALFRRRLTIARFVGLNVLQGVPDAEQQNTYENWFNQVQTQSQVEIFLGSSSGKRFNADSRGRHQV